ncbi:hypothetical protein SprV_0401501500 [Sparganum proliferum]
MAARPGADVALPAVAVVVVSWNPGKVSVADWGENELDPPSVATLAPTRLCFLPNARLARRADDKRRSGVPTGGLIIASSFPRCAFAYIDSVDLKLSDQQAADKNDTVENRWCQLRDTAQLAASAVIGRARPQHQYWFDDNDVLISNLLAEKDHLYKAYVDRPTNDNRAAIYRDHRLVQYRLREIKDLRRDCKADKIQKHLKRNGRNNLFAEMKAVYGPTARGIAPLLSIGGTTLLTEKTQIRK